MAGVLANFGTAEFGWLPIELRLGTGDDLLLWRGEATREGLASNGLARFSFTTPDLAPGAYRITATQLSSYGGGRYPATPVSADFTILPGSTPLTTLPPEAATTTTTTTITPAAAAIRPAAAAAAVVLRPPSSTSTSTSPPTSVKAEVVESASAPSFPVAPISPAAAAPDAAPAPAGVELAAHAASGGAPRQDRATPVWLLLAAPAVLGAVLAVRFRRWRSR